MLWFASPAAVVPRITFPGLFRQQPQRHVHDLLYQLQCARRYRQRSFPRASVDQVTMLEEPWAKDFRRYVGQSGDEGAISVTRSQVDPKNPDAALKDKTDAWRKQGIPVAQVNWKYAGG